MRALTFAVLMGACALRAAAAENASGVIRISATCPGADARTLDETVLVPIFRQVSGVEEAIRVESEARNDGSGTLTVYFEPTADLNLAEVRLQNRVNLALPAVPEPCRQQGISVTKVPAGLPQFWLALTATDPSLNGHFLSRYAMIQLKPFLNRVLGVVDARVVGAGDSRLQVLLNPEKLAAYKLSDRDVIDALRRQNNRVGAAGGFAGNRTVSTVTASGRLTNPEQFESVILRAAENGETLRIKDVARVELNHPLGGFVHVDGKPAALIAVTAWPGRVTIDRLMQEQVAGDLPPGARFDCIADRSVDHLLAVELQVPPGSRLEYTDAKVVEAAEIVRELPEQPSVFAFAEKHEPNAAMIFVKAGAEPGPTAADVDHALRDITNTKIRVADMPPGKEAFPVRIALIDPTEFQELGEADEARFRDAAERAFAALSKAKDVVAPSWGASEWMPQYAVEIDRDQCAICGVELNDLFTKLQTSLGGVHATDFDRWGRTFPVTVETSPEFARDPEDLTNLKIRSTTGDMIPLDRLIKIRKAMGAASVVRVNGYRAIVITAAAPPGKSPAEVAGKCVELARQALHREYRVMDLTGR